MNQVHTLLGLHCQTSVHVGAGGNVGVIDLPIQRESHTGWPCFNGSSMKGALREHAESKWKAGHNDVISLFGPDTNNASDHAGALMVSDARLLLLPVRSLTSQFKYVTSPSAIKRLSTDRNRLSLPATKLDSSAHSIADHEALVPKDNSAGALFLEEYRFKASATDLTALIETIAPLMNDADSATQALQQQLVIVSNDMFAHIAASATPVNAHIAIDSATKTVKPGALWYEESLPPETLLYSAVSATAARNSRSNPSANTDSADQVASTFRTLFAEQPWLQIGGNETVGMGWLSVQMEAST